MVGLYYNGATIMSFIVSEYLIGSILKDGLEYFKDHPELMSQVLTSHDSSLIEKAKYLVEKLPVKVVLSYPRTRLTAPIYAIFLEEEEEEINYVGDKIIPAATTTQTPIAVENESLDFVPFPRFQLLHKPVADLTIFCNGVDIPFTDFSLNGYTGEGNLADGYSADATYTASYTYFEQYLDPIGGLFRSTYRIECLSNNIEEVLILYRLAQFLLMSNRTGLSNIGLIKQSLAGSDLEPVASEDQPDFIYRRALFFTFSIEGVGTIPLPALQNIEVHPV
jgi:hypothetical protein